LGRALNLKNYDGEPHTLKYFKYERRAMGTTDRKVDINRVNFNRLVSLFTVAALQRKLP